MKKRKSFSINKIVFPNSNLSNLSKLLEKIIYNEESGYGISEIEEVNEILSALLIKRNSTYIQQYNLSEQIFEKKSIYIYSRIKFYIDFEYNLLYTNGPSTNLFQIISLLRNISGLRFDVSSLEVTPYKIYQLLKIEKIKFQLNELTIEKFNFKDGAIGKYTATISSMSIGIELIKLYKEDLSKIVFDLNSYKVYFYNNNILSIVGNIDEIEQNFQNFKNIIF